MLGDEAHYEMALEIIDAQGLDLNAILQRASEGLALNRMRAAMEYRWKLWILERRQGTKDIEYYGQYRSHHMVGEIYSVFIKDPTRTIKIWK